MRFRVHHIICTSLYKGLGYSGSFCENMTKKVTWLRENPNSPLMLITQADDICAGCPNLKEGKYCETPENHAHIRDTELLPVFHLEENKEYTYRELLEARDMFLTKEEFTKSCGTCNWYKEGICRFEDIKK